MNGLPGQPPDPAPLPQEIAHILKSCRKIAVVGLSPKPERDSHKVASYLLEQGYEVVPVNPGQTEILGRTCYGSLLEIPFRVDVVDLFLSRERVPSVVDQAIEIRARVVWMQLGITHEEAAQKARQAGLTVVMNHCIKQDHEKLAQTPPDSP